MLLPLFVRTCTVRALRIFIPTPILYKQTPSLLQASVAYLAPELHKATAHCKTSPPQASAPLLGICTASFPHRTTGADQTPAPPCLHIHPWLGWLASRHPLQPYKLAYRPFTSSTKVSVRLCKLTYHPFSSSSKVSVRPCKLAYNPSTSSTREVCIPTNSLLFPIASLE